VQFTLPDGLVTIRLQVVHRLSEWAIAAEATPGPAFTFQPAALERIANAAVDDLPTSERMGDVVRGSEAEPGARMTSSCSLPLAAVRRMWRCLCRRRQAGRVSMPNGDLRVSVEEAGAARGCGHVTPLNGFGSNVFSGSGVRPHAPDVPGSFENLATPDAGAVGTAGTVPGMRCGGDLSPEALLRTASTGTTHSPPSLFGPASSPSTGSGAVFSAAPTERFLRVEVRDTGVGIRRAELGLLFKPFEQLHSGNAATGVTGSGLGLSLCKRTIELMGGRVGATSELGKGSIFFFEVPLRGSDREEANGSVQASNSTGNTGCPLHSPTAGEGLQRVDGVLGSSERPRLTPLCVPAGGPQDRTCDSLSSSSSLLPSPVRPLAGGTSSVLPLATSTNGSIGGSTDATPAAETEFPVVRRVSPGPSAMQSLCDGICVPRVPSTAPRLVDADCSSGPGAGSIMLPSGVLHVALPRPIPAWSELPSFESNKAPREGTLPTIHASKLPPIQGSIHRAPPDMGDVTSAARIRAAGAEYSSFVPSLLPPPTPLPRDAGTTQLPLLLSPSTLAATPPPAVSAARSAGRAVASVISLAVVVDDVASNSALFARMLIRRGVQVVFTAADGVDCLAQLQELPPDLRLELTRSPRAAFFTDKSMPRMDGCELSRQLRAAGVTTLIFGVTGDALEEDQRVFLVAGANAVITKPCTASKIDAVLATAGAVLPRPRMLSSTPSSPR
jgi:CheY-like chemotaxis protein